jgi:tricarballylate dehydrogenase
VASSCAPRASACREAGFRRPSGSGIEIRYGTAATELLIGDDGRVKGVKVRDDDGISVLNARSAVFGCGGFEANVKMRTQHIGPLVGAAKVRGTAHNQGDRLRMAMNVGRMPCGQWRHATPIRADWGDFAPRN